MRFCLEVIGASSAESMVHAADYDGSVLTSVIAILADITPVYVLLEFLHHLALHFIYLLLFFNLSKPNINGSFPQLVILVLCLFELPSLPVYLLALRTPPEICYITVFINEVDLFLCLLSSYHYQFWVVALYASGQSCEGTEVKVKHLHKFFEHDVGVTSLFEKVDRDV